jgi:hypothetical protein
MEIAKALIIAGRGGSGDSPWPAAPGAPKHLFPVGNQPILFHNLTALRAAGVMEATILAEGGDAAAFERAAGDGRAWGMTRATAPGTRPTGCTAPWPASGRSSPASPCWSSAATRCCATACTATSAPSPATTSTR